MSASVALVHGFATDSARTWAENGWLDLLADVGREPVAIDLLGHGTADKPHDPAAYAGMEDLVAAQLPAGPVDAIGFSLGARVLLTLAIDRPDRFERLVLTGVGANLLRTEGSDLILRAIEGDGDPTNPVVQYFVGLAQHPDVDREALAACLRSPRPVLTPERLAQVEVPVLVVLGDQDFAGPGE
ncbi:MAG: alpha/beta fold hydrolase, partial [Acidimicrobiales bacterium]|nr:alpha/beta fold hydrolase [Acidimicrobiales bacterium]